MTERGSSGDQPKGASAKETAKAVREARLAKALRVNLKRRKAAAPANRKAPGA
jgi:hypothetical protein